MQNLVEEFGSTSSRCAFLRLRDRRGCKLWIASAHLWETAEDNNEDVFYDELNALTSKIPSQQVVIVGTDANAKIEFEQQSGVGIIGVISTWQPFNVCENSQSSTRLHSDEQHSSDIRTSKAVWDVAFDCGRPVRLSFKIRFYNRNREAPLQPNIEMAGVKERRMHNGILLICTYSCWSAGLEEAQRCGFFQKVHPGRCKRSVLVLLPLEKFAFASTEQNPHVTLYVRNRVKR